MLKQNGWSPEVLDHYFPIYLSFVTLILLPRDGNAIASMAKDHLLSAPKVLRLCILSYTNYRQTHVLDLSLQMSISAYLRRHHLLINILAVCCRVVAPITAQLGGSDCSGRTAGNPSQERADHQSFAHNPSDLRRLCYVPVWIRTVANLSSGQNVPEPDHRISDAVEHRLLGCLACSCAENRVGVTFRGKPYLARYVLLTRSF